VYCYFITQERDHFPLARPRLVTLRCHEYNDWYQNQATFQAQRVKIEHGRVAASARANSAPAARPAAYSLAVGGRRGSWALARPAPPGSWLPTLRTEAFKSSGAGAMRSRRAPLLALGPAPAFLPSAPRLRPTALSDGARRCRHRRNHSRSTGKTAWPEAALRPGARAAFWWWVAIEMWSCPGSTPFRRPWPGCPVSRYFSGSHSEV
jgi:hypothetical protein